MGMGGGGSFAFSDLFFRVLLVLCSASVEPRVAVQVRTRPERLRPHTSHTNVASNAAPDPGPATGPEHTQTLSHTRTAISSDGTDVRPYQSET